MSVEKAQVDDGGVYKIKKDCHLRSTYFENAPFQDNSNPEFNPLQVRGANAKEASPQKHKVIKKLKKGNFVKITSTLKNIFKIYFFNREHTRVKPIENGIITNIEGDMRTDCIGDKVDFTEGIMDFLHKENENSSILPKGNNTRLYVDLIASANIEGLENSSLKRLKLLQYLKLCMKASQSKVWFWDKYPALNLWLKNKKHISEFPQIIKKGDRTEVTNWIIAIEIDLANSEDWNDLKKDHYFQSIDNYEAQAKSNSHFERLLKKDQEMPAAHEVPSKQIEQSYYNESISSGMDVVSGDIKRDIRIGIDDQTLGEAGKRTNLTKKADNNVTFSENASEKINYILEQIKSIGLIIGERKNIDPVLTDVFLINQMHIIKDLISTLNNKLVKLQMLITKGERPTDLDNKDINTELRSEYTSLCTLFLELRLKMKNSSASIKKRNLHLLSNCHQRSQLYLLNELIQAPEYNNIIIPEDGTKLINQDKDQDSVIFNLEQARDDTLYKASFTGYYKFVFIPENEDAITLFKIKAVVNIFLSNDDKLIYNLVVSDDRADSKPFLLSFKADAFSNNARTAIEKDRSKLLEADQKR